MLTTLSIRNIVLVDSLTLSFRPGLCVLTGETGAGKSILLEALDLAIGARAELKLLRHGADKATVTAEFQLPADHPVQDFLQARDFPMEENLILKRVLSRDGKNKAYLNNEPVSLNFLKQIGEQLIEIHGQFKTYGLLDPKTHGDILDSFGELSVPREQVKESWTVWHTLEQESKTLAQDMMIARQEEDFLRHSIQELGTLDLQDNEEEALVQQRTLLMNHEKILEAVSAGHAELEKSNEMLGTARRYLSRVTEQAAGKLDTIEESLGQIDAVLQEALADLSSLANETSREGLEDIEERLFALRALARKHNTGVNDLSALQVTLEARLSLIEDQGEKRNALNAQTQAARKLYTDHAEHLSALRKKTADRLNKAINQELPPVKLEKARFESKVETLEEGAWNKNGKDRVVFLLSTNPGLPSGPLHKIASGGELSRLMLVLQLILAQTNKVPTLIFDEIDNGVGGRTADAVGERLARLAQNCQVLVVTHSPQITASASHHFYVEKRHKGNSVTTHVSRLDETQRTEELARMLSGAVITDEARAAAQRLINVEQNA